MSPAYPRELNICGDHIRKRRLDLGLLQKEVAVQLGVDKDTVFAWERGIWTPSVYVLPRIVEFLGYIPYDPGAPLGDRLRLIRMVRGLSQKQAAHLIGVDPGTLNRWEWGISFIQVRFAEKVKILLRLLPSDLDLTGTQ